MRITSINDNLTQITRLRFVNAYLVHEDDGLTLVDTTLKGAGKDLIAAAGDDADPADRADARPRRPRRRGGRAARGARRRGRVPARGARRADPQR